MPSYTPRLEGLDIARCLAFIGMVFVNFSIVMTFGHDDASSDRNGFLEYGLASMLEGRAAAAFVVLAGVGLGLAGQKYPGAQTMGVTFRRALFLFLLGMLNLLIFDADILHFYGVYFFIGALLLGWGTHKLLITIASINLLYFVLIMTLDYDAGWNWKDFTYPTLWTFDGFLRNLLFNGWHPVLPWVSFLLYGMVLSRAALADRRTQWWLVICGVLVVALAETLSAWLQPVAITMGEDLVYLVTTEPIPPMALYMLAAGGVATVLVSVCLLITPLLSRTPVLAFLAPAGRQTLTLYMAHIILGMGCLEWFGLLSGQSIATAYSAAALFCLGAIAYAWLWSRFFRHGPIEYVMRKLTGHR